MTPAISADTVLIIGTLSVTLGVASDMAFMRERPVVGLLYALSSIVATGCGLFLLFARAFA